MSVGAIALAQFAVERQTLDNGGGALNGPTYALTGTVAQPDANPPLTGSTYTLRGGFWTGQIDAPANSCLANFDNDADVDLGDCGVFGGAFGSSSGDINFNADADFNGDGDIDLGDFGIFGAEFGRTDCLD